jgi:hypothetical protein
MRTASFRMAASRRADKRTMMPTPQTLINGAMALALAF